MTLHYLIRPICLSLCLLSLFGCKTEQKSETDVDDVPEEVQIEQALFDEVMVVHDEMMERMEDMMRMKGQLIEQRDSLKRAGQAQQANTVDAAVAGLAQADEAMMDWMRNFKPQKEKPHQEVVTYYTIKKEQMDSVKLVMLQSIGAAENLLD